MFLRHFSTLFTAVLAVSTLSASAQVIRSGNFITCDVSKDCTQETIDGKRFYVIQAPQMTVKVAIDPDPKYSHIAVSLENRAPYEIHVTPSEFRIEVSEPKFKRLSYIEPEKLHLPKVKSAKSSPAPSKAAVTNSFAASAPSTSQVGGPSFLTETVLAPSAATSGEVFFERANGGGASSVLLPIAGVIYEFPFTAPK